MNKIKQDYLLEIVLFILAFATIFALREYIGGKNVSLFYCIAFVLVMGYNYINKIKKPIICNVYIVALSTGFLAHVLMGFCSFSRVGDDLFARLLPIMIMSILLYKKSCCRIFQLFFFAFYIIECGISIYEKLSMVHLIDYSAVEDLQATSFEMNDSIEFRSFSLMFHPLYNANTISICLAFIFFQNINFKFKFLLLVLGLLSLWAFNSRGAIMVWIILLLYRLVFYRTKMIFVLFLSTILYFVIPILVDYIVYTEMLGRLSNTEIFDGSSLTRLMAFDEFSKTNWDLNSILFGGRLLCYHGTDVSLENGALLDLGYWGILIGTIKILGEIVVTFWSVQNYQLKQKVFIMIATWGVAFMNNNSFSNWLISIFVFGLITFGNLNSKDNESLISC